MGITNRAKAGVLVTKLNEIGKKVTNDTSKSYFTAPTPGDKKGSLNEGTTKFDTTKPNGAREDLTPECLPERWNTSGLLLSSFQVIVAERILIGLAVLSP